MSICFSCGRCAVGGTAAGEDLVEALVALDDAGLHAAGDEGVPVGEGVHQRRRGQPGATVAEVLEHELLQGDAVRHALEGERLDDELVRPHLVEAATEAVLLTVLRVHVAVGAAGAAVEVVDRHGEVPRAEPLDEEVRVGVGAEHLLRRGVELADDPDQRDVGVGDDLGLVVSRAGHDGVPSWGDGAGSTASGIDRRTSSSRR
jgi:hypothetical protein